MKFTGKASMANLSINQTDCIRGVIFTNNGFRIKNCEFNSEDCGIAVTAIKIDGTNNDITGGIIEDIKIIGNSSYTTGLEIINCTINDFSHIHIHDCLEGIKISGTNSQNNIFDILDIGASATGIKIVEGSAEHFYNVTFHGNTLNINDIVDTNIWINLNGEFETTIYPINLTGISVPCGNGTWGADTEIRSSATATKPFKVLGYSLEPSDEESTLIRFSADSGVTFFAQDVFASKKDKASGGGNTTDFIFNAGDRISASVWSPTTGRTVNVWLEIQEI